MEENKDLNAPIEDNEENLEAMETPAEEIPAEEAPAVEGAAAEVSAEVIPAEEVTTEEPEEPENANDVPVKVESYWPVLPDSLTLDITGDPVLLAEYIKALPLQGKYRMRVCLERVVEAGE